jgi:butyryl-CoA dehydrogenase
MDFSLTEEQVAVRDLAARFVDREILPHATAWDRAEQVDRAIVPALGRLGLLGMTIPEQYGGSGGDHVAYCLALEELGRGDSSVRGIVSVSLGLVAKNILAYGNEAQRQRWLPRLCAGEALGCFALTEPDTGSDAASLSTRATRAGDGWRLDGTKMFITNGTWAEAPRDPVRRGSRRSSYRRKRPASG